MTDKKLNNLFSLLNEGRYQTAEALAAEMKVSEKTIRSYLKRLNDELENHGACIVSKYGAGYCLLVKDRECFQEYQKRYFDGQVKLPDTSEERIEYLIKMLLTEKGYVRLEDLSERLYISTRTLATDLKEVEKCFHEYGLILERKPYYGIRLTGDEFSVRLCMAKYTGKMAGLMAEGEHILGVIGGCIKRSLKEENFHLSDIAFQNLAVHIYIAVMRMEERCYVSSERKAAGIPEQAEYRIAYRILDELRQTLGIDFPESEVEYLAIHLAGKKTNSDPEKNLVISYETDKLVSDMLNRIFDAYQFDFRDDLELRMMLCQHMEPLKIRLKYDMKLKNPLLHDIRERFSLAYAMAEEASSLLVTCYHKKISEDEIGYLALSIALALERQKDEVVKKNILLVCSTGQGSARLLAYKYQAEFGDYINTVRTCEVNQIHKVNFDTIDYVFTTVPITDPIPVPILEVQYFLEPEDIRIIKKVLTNKDQSSIDQYYGKELFLPHLNMETKEEVLRYLCGYAETQLKVESGLYELVLERERMARTEFGNWVAMPHPMKAVARETKVVVGILDRPILWGENKVQVIFLVCIENRKNVDLQKFYDVTANFLMDERCIHELIKNQDYSKFIARLKDIEMKRED